MHKKESCINAAKKGAGDAKRSRKEDRIERIVKKTGLPEDEIREEAKWAKQNLGIALAKFEKWDLAGLPQEKMVAKAVRKQKQKAQLDKMYAAIKEECGKERASVIREMAKIRAREVPFRVTLPWYFIYGLYELDVDRDEKEIDERINRTVLRKELLEEFSTLLPQYEQGLIADAVIDKLVLEYRELLQKDLSEGRKRQLWESIKDIRSDLMDDPARQEELLVDMELTRILLGFASDEYVSFHFWEKSIHERCEYVSSELKTKVIQRLNSGKAKRSLDSKYRAYELLKEYYGREIVLLEADQGYQQFVEYCKTHPTFVKKGNFDAMGKGVQKVTLQKNVALQDIYDDITKDGKLIILEDLIDSSEEIRRLNPDSVNTVRIIVFLDDEGPVIQDCFMKIGRTGKFVDNGGAGGLLVHINKETGVFDSVGIDEKGFRYDKHPDHGYTIMGYSLPQWEDACRIAKEAIFKIPGLRYVGWDLTFTSDQKWIIVEGNGLTQFIGQQATIDKGIKKQFLKATGYKGETV